MNEFLKQFSRPIEAFEYKGQVINLRSPDAGGRLFVASGYDAKQPNEANTVEAYARLMVVCMVDANGVRLCQDSDIATIRDLDGDFVTKIGAHCMRLAGLAADDGEAAKKNCEPTPN